MFLSKRGEKLKIRSKKIKRSLNKNSKRGAALAETILLVAISLVLVIVIFYPQITSLFNSLISTMTTWFNNAISIIGSTPT